METIVKACSQPGQLEAVFAAITDAIVVYDAGGIAWYANPAAVAAWGFHPAGMDAPAIIQRLALCHPNGQPVLVCELPANRALAGETVVNEPLVLKDAAGRGLVVLASASPLTMDGQVSGAVAVWREITEQARLMARVQADSQELEAANRRLTNLAEEMRDQAETLGQLIEENRRQREFLEKLVENAPIGIAVIEGPDHRYVLANPAYRAIPGIPDVPMLGRTLSEVFPAVAAQGALAFPEAVYRTGKTVSIHQYEASVGPGREETYWDVDHVPLRGADGQVDAVLILAHDVTEEVRSRRPLAFLAEASGLLGASLDYEATLERVAHLVVPRLADYCSVYILGEDGVIQQVAAAHVIPEKVDLVRAYWQDYAPHIESDSPTARMLRAGQPEMVPEIPDGWFETFRGNARRYASLLGLKPRSYIGVPFVARGRTLGGMTLAWAESERHYGPLDLALAQELARRAALAIDNARLYSAEQHARQIAEQAALQAEKLAAYEERQRLARELHDSVAQALYSIGLAARTAHTLLERDPSRAGESLEFVVSLADAGLTEMRALVFDLRPESLHTEGLVAMLDLRAALLRARYKIEVHTELCDEPNVPLDVKEAIYSIAREALHNIVKHASASRVDVWLGCSPAGLVLEVGDDGRGFDASSSLPGHHGLEFIRERVSQLGGTLDIHTSRGQGTHIRVEIPAPRGD